VNDWDALEKLWDHAFYCLGVDPAEKPLLFTESLLNSKDHREKLTEIVFEKYKPGGLFIAKEPTLSAFACGRATALVLDSGADMTLVTTVHDGYSLQKTSMSRSIIAGNYITDVLYSMIHSRIQSIGEIRPKYLFNKKQHKGKWEISLIPRPNTTASYHNYQVRLILNDLKEALCRVSEEPFDENSSVTVQSYELPDGNIIQLEKERYRVTELMFQSNFQMGGHTQHTVRFQDMVTATISNSDVDIHKELYSNIIVTGGNSLFKGFAERLQKEIANRGTQHPIKIRSPQNSQEKKFLTWIGGSILGSIPSFQQMWMSKEEYEEVGKTLVHSKCP